MHPFLITCSIALGFTTASLCGNGAKTPEGLGEDAWTGIREAYEHGRHAIVPNSDGTHQARNPGQNWLTRFDGRGFSVTPDDSTWSWGLDLDSYGYPGHERYIANSPTVTTNGGKLEYRHDANLTEWFINDSRGLEQGWTLQQRPDGHHGGTALQLELRLRGGLVARVAADGESVGFVDSRGSDVIRYSGLKAWDADRKPVQVKFASAGNDGKRFLIDVSDAEAVYPITIDPIAQQAYLKASNTEANDGFGHSVSVSGDTVVVGAWHESSSATGVNGNQSNNSAEGSGAAYVFVRNGSTWTQQAYLKASNTESSTEFGTSVAVSGDTVVVGCPRESGNSTGVNGNQTVGLAGQAGAAYVFVRNGTNWSQQAYLKASNTGSGDHFGESIAIAGNTVVVGAPDESSSATGVNGNQADDSAGTAGAAYVFSRNGTNWTQQAYLKASNTTQFDYFGFSVAVSGETVVVGAKEEDSNATGVGGAQNNNLTANSGAAYVFVRSGILWTQQAYLKASNTGAQDEFGYSVAISGETLVVGAWYESSNATGVNGNQANDSATGAGAAYVFLRSGTLWNQQAYLKGARGFDQRFGNSVGISGETIVVGSVRDDSISTYSGAAYVFSRTGATWGPSTYLRASNAGYFDFFGQAVAVSGDNVVVGADYEGSNSTGVNGNQLSDSADQAGAAYVFNITYKITATSTNGSINGAGDYGYNSTATVTAVPKAGYIFSTWTGDASGTTNPLSILVNSNKTIAATFIPDTRDPDADGLDNYNEIVVHGTDPNVADTDGDGYSDGYEVQFSTNPKSPAGVPTFTLTLVNNGTAAGGSFSKSGNLAHGTNATLTAAPDLGYLFGNWTNSASGNNNPLTLLMDSNKTVGATFVPDTRDTDGDGLDNYNEIIVLMTNPDLADTDGDGYSDGYEIQFSTNPKSGTSVPKFVLTLVSGGVVPGGSFTKSGSLAHGTNATLTATPAPGHVFEHWTGEATGSSSVLALLMDSNKSVGATFLQDTLDPDGDGLDNYTEIVLQDTDPDLADTDGDGYSDGYEVQFSTDPKNLSSVPTFTLTLVNGGSTTGGGFTKSGSLAHGTQATLSATPLAGYQFEKWTNDAAGNSNPLTLLMDSNKSVGAKFVHDPRDPDGDGLNNYQEIILLKTNPAQADTDGDGVDDGMEVGDKTNPNVPDTDKDGLVDGVEKQLRSDPLRKDSDGDGTPDSDEDGDNDGIGNGREANELGTKPNKSDSDGDGLTDTFELAFTGETEPFTPRIGDRILLDFKRLRFPGTMRIDGILPAGLQFDPVKQVLKGTLVGEPGSYAPSLQLFDGRTFLRSISLPFRVIAFPGGLAGSYEGLLENKVGQPVGWVAVKVTPPGTEAPAAGMWNATVDVAGTTIIRKASGSVTLDPAKNSALLDLSFPAETGLPAITIALQIETASPLADGKYFMGRKSAGISGTVRGFRLIKGTPKKKEDRAFTLVIDQGEQDGFAVPAGIGWATGSLSAAGEISMTGQLGDSRAFKTTSNLSATGQAIVWVKPYENPNSSLGGIISFRESRLAGSVSKKYQNTGLSWVRDRDPSELSYPDGFGPLQAHAGVASYEPPATAARLAEGLGLVKQTFGDVLIEGGGLPVPDSPAVLPQAFLLKDDFALVAKPVPGHSLLAWQGSIAKSDGTFSGTLKLPASDFGLLAGSAKASGVLVPGAGYEGILGAGLLKFPTNERPGAFRTAAIVISK